MEADQRTAHTVSMLAQLQEKHPLIATHDRWLMAKPGEQPEPCLKEGQSLVLESIDVDNFCYYPPLSQDDLNYIADLIDFESDGVCVYYWRGDSDMPIGIKFEDVGLEKEGIIVPLDMGKKD